MTASSERTCSEWVESVGTAVVRKTWLPTQTGEDQPRPGIARFHRMFSVVLQCVGSPDSGRMPLAVGSAELKPVIAARRERNSQ